LKQTKNISTVVPGMQLHLMPQVARIQLLGFS
jgi:hypothetical protein